MGVIKKEGIKHSIIAYIGVLIGIINTMYFYPKYFTEEELGLFRFLMDTAMLLFPLVSIGVHNLSVRMFPTFKNKENGHNGLLAFLLGGLIIGYSIFLLGIFFGYPFINGIFSTKSILIKENWTYIIPLAGLIVFAEICTQYLLNFKKVLIPAIFNDIFIKIGLPFIAVGLYFDFLSIINGVLVLIGIYVVRLIALIGYIFYLKEWYWRPNWVFLTKPLLMEMKTYSFYGILGSLGSIIATRIDIFMIALLATNDLKDVGIYSIAMLIATVITVPARSINNISSPILAESFNSNDFQNIKSVYTKSSIVLLTIGLLFMIGIWSSIDDVFSLMPNGEKYAVGKYVILILGIGILFDLATGTNGQIISFSKYFRFNFHAVLILAIINIIANYIFIPIYQINGAALATTSSMVIFNLSKFIYIRYKMKIQPFSWNTLKVLIIGTGVMAIGLSIPAYHIPLIDIIIRSSIIAFFFIGAVIYFNISEDMTNLFWQVLSKFKIIRTRK